MRNHFYLSFIRHSWYLLAQTAYQSLHQANVPKDDARLHVLNRILA